MFRFAKTRFSRALLTLAVALLPVFSGISGGLHLMLVRHVVCRAHGELIHADQKCAVDVAAVGEHRSTSETPAPALRSVPSGREIGDEHCQIVLLSRASFDLWHARDSTPVAARDTVQLATRAPAPRERSIEPLVLAPKQSPPV